MPKVSVIVPNFNHEKFLASRLSSILDQSFRDFELVYLDDCSTDNSKTIFSEFENDPRVRSIENTVNSGSPFPQWAKGIACSTGQYIWIAEADDFSDTNFLSTMVAVLDSDESIGLSYCDSQCIDEEDCYLELSSSWLSSIDKDRWQHDFTNIGTEECKRYLVVQNTIHNASSVVFRRSAYLRSDGIDTSMKVCGDWLLWSRILAVSNIAYSSKPLNFFRLHKSSVVRKASNSCLIARESYQVVAWIASQLCIDEKPKEESLSRLANLWIDGIRTELGSTSISSIAEIYYLAAQIDPDLKMRLIKSFVRKLQDKLTRPSCAVE